MLSISIFKSYFGGFNGLNLKWKAHTCNGNAVWYVDQPRNSLQAIARAMWKLVLRMSEVPVEHGDWRCERKQRDSTRDESGLYDLLRWKDWRRSRGIWLRNQNRNHKYPFSFRWVVFGGENVAGSFVSWRVDFAQERHFLSIVKHEAYLKFYVDQWKLSWNWRCCTLRIVCFRTCSIC